MLRQTLVARTNFQDPQMPRVLDYVTHHRITLAHIHIKEKFKAKRHYGSFFHDYGDRAIVYNAMGGPAGRGSRFIIEKHTTRAQFLHPSAHHDKWDIRSVKLAGSQYDQPGNITKTRWDQMSASTNLMQNPVFHKNYTAIKKQAAIDQMEEWGFKFILQDETRRPSVDISKYHRHALYAHKFYYTPDPVTNHRMGDADWKWRGQERITYGDCGAQSKDARNAFRSLWHSTTAAAAAPKGGAAKAAKPSKPRAPTAGAAAGGSGAGSLAAAPPKPAPIAAPIEETEVVKSPPRAVPIPAPVQETKVVKPASEKVAPADAEPKKKD